MTGSDKTYLKFCTFLVLKNMTRQLSSLIIVFLFDIVSAKTYVGIVLVYFAKDVYRFIYFVCDIGFPFK